MVLDIALTEKQKMTLQVVVRLQKNLGRFPRLRELANELGLKSHLSAYDRLKALINKGVIEYQPTTNKQLSPFSVSRLAYGFAYWIEPGATTFSSRVASQGQIVFTAAYQINNSGQMAGTGEKSRIVINDENKSATNFSEEPNEIEVLVNNQGIDFKMSSTDSTLIFAILGSLVFSTSAYWIFGKNGTNIFSLLSVVVIGLFIALFFIFFKLTP